MTVATSAAATPGAIVVRLAELFSAILANVDITPQTVPNKPMNGPPATAVDSTIMPFSKPIASAPAASSRVTRTASKEATLILVTLVLARISVCSLATPGGKCPTMGRTRPATTTGLFFK